VASAEASRVFANVLLEGSVYMSNNAGWARARTLPLAAVPSKHRHHDARALYASTLYAPAAFRDPPRDPFENWPYPGNY
jgi:hypothetical protein